MKNNPGSRPGYIPGRLTPPRPGAGPYTQSLETGKTPGTRRGIGRVVLVVSGIVLLLGGITLPLKSRPGSKSNAVAATPVQTASPIPESPALPITDSLLQKRVTVYLERYRPEGAVVAICGLRNGKLLALAERDSLGVSPFPKLALSAGYPAASLVKIVTAAAYLEQGSNPDDSLPRLGRNHTLYRFQLRPPEKVSYPKITLRDAFAHSVNPAFGILGLRMGSTTLRDMAQRLGFNTPWPSQNISASVFQIPDTGYGLAEASCGFTTSITLSPLHALQIARAIGDDGKILPPLPTGKAAVSTAFLAPGTLDSLRSLMAATVFQGTARKGFRRNLPVKVWDDLEMGGKTGSLDGRNPPGRYEWYIGYAHLKASPDLGIAVAVMMINRTVLAVHAAEFAALLVRDWERSALRASVARR